MALRKQDSIDLKVAKIYQEKVTVNLDARSTLKPEEFWSSMEIIAFTNKALINFKCA